MIDELGLAGKVELHGEVPQEEIPGALRRADLCVIPNRSDPIMELAFPTKLLEALLMGVPVVASSTWLVQQTFMDGGVHFVPPGDVEALAGAMLDLAKNRQSREALAAEGKRQVRRFDWKKEQQKLLSLYEDLGVQILK
jgi:glycosyltransferase involved in cell wall biosynthesis